MVRDFWCMVGNILTSYYPDFRLGQREAIFGDINSKGDSVINTVILISKQFLWRQKFGSKNIDELQFILYMKSELEFLLKTADFKGEKSSFYMVWDKILKHFDLD